MSKPAKVPDNDTDWQAIDIFVFSNGQQYSPPRKYHLRMEDLNLWKSTLQYLAETQYGPSTANFDLDYPENLPGSAVERFFEVEEILIQRQSMVDLYTLEGKKLVGPLDLSNGTSYVAVAPQDIFVDAGYDKYLIRATRSWEKRQASKTENVTEKEESGNNGTVTKMEQIAVRVEDFNLRPLNDSATLKTVVSSMVDNDFSVITKPQLSLGSQKKPNSLLGATETVKSIEKKKPPIQRSSFNRKIILPSPPTSNLKPSFKKNDAPKTVIITKKSRPDYENNSSPATANNQVNKLIAKSKMVKPTIKPKEPSIRSQAVLPKVEQVANELKTSSSIKMINTNNGNLSQNFVELKSISEDKETNLVSKLFQNSQRELPSIALTPMSNHSNLIKQQAMTEINDDQVRENGRLNSEIQIGLPIRNMIRNFSIDKDNINLDKEIEKKLQDNIMEEKPLIEYPTYPTHTIKHKVEENTDLNNEVTIITSKSNDNITIHDSSLQNHLVTPNNLSNRNVTNKTERNLNLSDLIISTPESNKATNSHKPLQLRPSIIAGKVFVGEYKKHEIEEPHDLTLTSPETSSNDQYVIKILKKSDIVNLKLKIEIENYNDRDRLANNIANHSEMNTYTEKVSQTNIDEQLATQNKSLLSLIVKEVNDLNITNNHHLIIIQCNACKICNGRSGAVQDENSSKNYEKAKEKYEGCESSQPRPDIRFASLPTAETTCSCTSQQIMTNHKREIQKEAASQNICGTDQSTTVNIVEDVVSVSRKKSVSVIEDSAPNTREVSKISQEVVTKSQLYAVSVESIRVLPKTAVDNFTQTEWCDVLLEARVIEGGHYTFHLPPIELLKFHKLM